MEVNKESDRIDSWKQIAAHLGKSERTVRRWQSDEGLPVHRHVHQERGTVWAYKSEIDQWLDSRKESPKPLLEEPEAPQVPRRKLLWLAVGLPLIGLGVGLTRSPAPPVIPQEEVLTSLPGTAFAPALSPDGRKVAFFWSGNEAAAGIYLKEIGFEAVSPLATSKTVGVGFIYAPAWSPDGKTIAYLHRTYPRKLDFAKSANSNETWLCLIDATGGQERRLVRVAEDNTIYANNTQLSWTPDGKRILAPMGDGDKRGIYWIPIGAGDPVPLIRQTSVSYSAPILSPTGKALLYMSKTGPPQASIESLYYQALNADGTLSGTPRLLSEARTMTSGLAWMPSEDEILLCRADNALVGGFNNRIYRLRIGASSEPAPVGLNNCSSLSIQSPAAGGQVLLAYGSGNNTKAGIWQASLSQLEKSGRIVPSSRFDSMATFSPDASMIAFISNRSGAAELWVASREGLNPRKLTEGSGIASVPSWSPDGSKLLYGASTPPGSAGKSESSHRVFTVAITGGQPVAVPLGALHATDPFWASTPNEFFFWVGGQIWQSNLNGQGPRMLREFPSHWFRASLSKISKGRHVLHTRSANPFALYSADLDSGKENLIADGLHGPAFASSRKHIYFMAKEGKTLVLCAIPHEGGPVKNMGPIPDQNSSQFLLSLDVTQDDSTMIWSFTEEQRMDLMLVRNLK